MPGRLSSERNHIRDFVAVVGLYWLFLLLDKPGLLAIAVCHVYFSSAPWLVGIFFFQIPDLSFCFLYIPLLRLSRLSAVAPAWATRFTVCQWSYSNCVVRVSLTQKNLLVLVWLEKGYLTVGRGTRGMQSPALVSFFKAAD